MAQIVVRETVHVPAATPPVPWKREINMPPAEWFRGEWLPARWAREEQEWNDRIRERRFEIFGKIALYAVGTAGILAGLAMYIAAGLWIGSF